MGLLYILHILLSPPIKQQNDVRRHRIGYKPAIPLVAKRAEHSINAKGNGQERLVEHSLARTRVRVFNNVLAGISAEQAMAFWGLALTSRPAFGGCMPTTHKALSKRFGNNWVATVYFYCCNTSVGTVFQLSWNSVPAYLLSHSR